MPMSYDKPRKHRRIASTPDAPITVSFKEKELRDLVPRIEVKDISLVGMGLKVPLGKRFLQEGMLISDMEIMLPGGTKCVLSGKVVYKRLGHCGVEFTGSNPAEMKKLDAFTSDAEK